MQRDLATEREDLDAVVGDRDRVLAVRREAARRRAQGPAVLVDHEPVGVGHDPRLDREQHAGDELLALAAAPVVGDMRALVHRRADTVATELRVDGVPGLAQNLADCGRDVTDPRSRARRGDSLLRRPSCAICAPCCIVEPTPWPPNSVSPGYPALRRTLPIAAETSPTRDRGPAAAIPASSARSVTSMSRVASGRGVPTTTLIAA